MTVAPPTAFPGGRVLAGWWRQLSQTPLGPIRGVWFGHLLLHRVESLFEIVASSKLDSVSHMLLHALALAPARGLADLDASLHLGGAVVHRLLGDLQAAGLVEPGGPGEWKLTLLGRQVQGGDGFVRTERQRRVLHFVEDRAPQPPHFLKLPAAAGTSWTAGEGWQFDPIVIERCLEQSAEWKQRHGFPPELKRLLGPTTMDAVDAAWQGVILDRPEHLMVLLLQVGTDSPGSLIGYTVRPDGWVLQTTQPVLTLTEGWEAVFPDLAEEPLAEMWLQAWRAWCQPRGLPAAEVEACTAERQGHILRVQAPDKLTERLKSARSDVVKGEAWLLAGSGQIRPAAVIELI